MSYSHVILMPEHNSFIENGEGYEKGLVSLKVKTIKFLPVYISEPFGDNGF